MRLRVIYSCYQRLSQPIFFDSYTTPQCSSNKIKLSSLVLIKFGLFRNHVKYTYLYVWSCLSTLFPLTKLNASIVEIYLIFGGLPLHQLTCLFIYYSFVACFSHLFNRICYLNIPNLFWFVLWVLLHLNRLEKRL